MDTNHSSSLSSSASQGDAVFNLDAALQRMDGDADLLNEVIDVFLEDYPNSLQQLRSSAEARDLKLVLRTAHTLKGVAGNFAANSVTEVGHQVETLCKADQLTEAISLVPMLESRVLILAEALRRHRQKEAA